VENRIRNFYEGGRPDRLLVTPENQLLFQQYREFVSPDPVRLIDEALTREV